MQYTITVDASNEQAIRFIDFVKMLAENYSFLKIETAIPIFTEEQEAEIDQRCDEAMQNPENGKSWEDVERNLYTQ